MEKLDQHWFECKRCSEIRVIYAKGEVLHAPCRMCGQLMKPVHNKQSRLNITVSVQEPETEEKVLYTKSLTVSEVLCEQLTLFDVSAV